jgi:hypothetical protein
VKKKALSMYIDALYRGVGQNFSTLDKYKEHVIRYQSDDGGAKEKPKDKKDTQRQARLRQTKAKERERTHRTKDKQAEPRRTEQSKQTQNAHAIP